MAFRVRFKKGVNISRVVTKIVGAILVLYVGGQILTEVGGVMNGTASVFYPGLQLIGWTVETVTNATSTQSCAQHDGGGNTVASCITDVTTGTGLLTVVGIIAIASVVMEFVKFRL